MDTKALIEERVKLHEENKALLDKASAAKRTLTAEEQTEWDRREARMGEIRGTLDRAEKQAVVDAEERALSESRGRQTQTMVKSDAPTDQDRQDAFRAWALGRHADERLVAAARRCGVNIHGPSLDMAIKRSRNENGDERVQFVPVRTNSDLDIIEERALSVGTTDAGGYSVPDEVMRAFYETQKWYGNVRAVAGNVTTSTGATLPWPKVTDTANSGEILAEATAATTTVDPTFGIVNIAAYKFSSKAVLVSWELLQDSFIDLSSYLGMALARRIGRIQNTKFTVGAGTTEPTGVVVGSAAGATSSATNAFTFDDIITLAHSVDPAYRGMAGVGFMMHDTVASYVRKLKDGNQRYMWEISTQVGQPDRLFGAPVYINNDMSATFTTGQKLMLFGWFKGGYLVRDAGAVRFVRSDELYVLQHQVLFEASQRSSAETIDSTAIKHLKTG